MITQECFEIVLQYFPYLHYLQKRNQRLGNFRQPEAVVYNKSQEKLFLFVVWVGYYFYYLFLFYDFFAWIIAKNNNIHSPFVPSCIYHELHIIKCLYLVPLKYLNKNYRLNFCRDDIIVSIWKLFRLCQRI